MACGLLAAAAPAFAQEQQGSLLPSGSIRIQWRGDAAAGCAAAGVCGYAGAVTVTPDAGDLEQGSFAEGEFEIPDAPVVRVTRGEGGQVAGTCVGRLALDALGVSLAPAGRRHLQPQLFSFGDTLSPGRCAGPLLGGALSRLAPAPVRRSALRGGTLDLRGSAAYSSGPFAVEVRSTLTARAVVAPTGNGVFGSNSAMTRAPHARRIRMVALEVGYDMPRFSGTSHIAFDGLPSPRCVPFDSCALRGSSVYSLDLHDRALSLTAAMRVSRSARHPRRLALRALRRGGLDVEGYTDLYERQPRLATTTVSETRDGAPACADSHRVEIPPLAIVGRGSSVQAVIGEQNVGDVPDIAASFCPGPLQDDAVGPGVLARGRVPANALLRRSLTIRLTGSHTFGAAGYAGATSSSYVIHLRRRSLRARFLTVASDRP